MTARTNVTPIGVAMALSAVMAILLLLGMIFSPPTTSRGGFQAGIVMGALLFGVLPWMARKLSED